MEEQQLRLVQVQSRFATAAWRQLVIMYWRQCPSFADAERLFGLLDESSRSMTGRPGLWLVTDAACDIPSVSVRRMMAARLRRCHKLQFHAVSVVTDGPQGTLMRAAMRSVSVAAGIHSSHVASDVDSVASQLPEHFPALGRTWGIHVVQSLRTATARTAEYGSVPPSLLSTIEGAEMRTLRWGEVV